MNDFYINNNYEIEIRNGDILLSGSQIQDVNIILNSQKGHLRYDDFIGFHLIQFLNNKYRPNKFDRDLNEQMTYANIDNLEIVAEIKSGKLNVNVNEKF